jgi:hypothetical protein
LGAAKLTIAVTIRVNAGVVMASDSAVTISAGDRVLKAFYNADKIVNLCRGYPVGVVFFGAGSIGLVALSTVAKDFRATTIEGGYDWSKCRVEEVNDRFCDYLQGRCKLLPDDEKPGTFGFYMAGFSQGEDLPEVWHSSLEKGLLKVKERDTTPWGIVYDGMRQPLDRLIYGFDNDLLALLDELGIDKNTQDVFVGRLLAKAQAVLIYPPMPIQDAIDLARCLVETAGWYWRFSPGVASVGGPVELATLTKHEGFRWVARKHWFQTATNPIGGGGYELPQISGSANGGAKA